MVLVGNDGAGEGREMMEVMEGLIVTIGMRFGGRRAEGREVW